MARGYGRRNARALGGRPIGTTDRVGGRSRAPRPDGSWAVVSSEDAGDGGEIAAAHRPPPRHGSDGLQWRFSKIPDLTPRGVLDDPLWVPAPSGDFAYDEDALFNDYDTISAGQFSQAAGGGPSAHRQRSGQQELLTVTWDWLALTNYGVDPDDFRDSLRRVLRAKKPVELLVTMSVVRDVAPELRMAVTLRKVSVRVKVDQPDSRYITVDYTESRDPKMGRRTSKHPRARGKRLPAKHRLTASDSLHSLSMAYFGSYVYARDIAQANNIHGFGLKTPLVQYDHWRVGTIVTIPQVRATRSAPSEQAPVAIGELGG